MNFLLRHPVYAAANPRRSWEITKAQADHRKKNPACRWTGKTTGCESHHIRSYLSHPELGADPANFVTLCRAAHWMVGHGGTSWKVYVENVVELCEAKRVIGQ